MLGLPHCPRAALVWFFQTKLFRPSENTSGPVSWLGWCLCLCNGDIGSSIVWLWLDDFFTCGTAFPSKLWISAYNLNITVLKRSCSTSPSVPTNSNYPSQPLRHRTRFQVEYRISLKWALIVYLKFWTNVHKKSSHCKANWTLYVRLVAPSGPSVIGCY